MAVNSNAMVGIQTNKFDRKNDGIGKASSISDSNSANSPLFDPPSLIGCNLKIDCEENINFGSILMQPLAGTFFSP